jgi:hypothetical protein
MTAHNMGKYCNNKCSNHHIVHGDSACNVTGTRITNTKFEIIYAVGCASYNNGHEPHTDKNDLKQISKSPTEYHVITKEELGEIIDITEDISLVEGWIKKIQPLVNKRMELTTKILSRPDPLVEIADLKQSLDFYKTRCNLIQKYQSKMRDPERKVICDILANGVYHE